MYDIFPSSVFLPGVVGAFGQDRRGYRSHLRKVGSWGNKCNCILGLPLRCSSLRQMRMRMTTWWSPMIPVRSSWSTERYLSVRYKVG